MLEEMTNNIIHWWSWLFGEVTFMRGEEREGERGYINFVFIIVFEISLLIDTCNSKFKLSLSYSSFKLKKVFKTTGRRNQQVIKATIKDFVFNNICIHVTNSY